MTMPPKLVHGFKKLFARFRLNRKSLIIFAKEMKKPLFFATLILLVLMILVPILTYAYFIWDMSSKESIMNRKNSGVILLDRNDQPFFTFYEAQTKEVASLGQIPDATEQAVIAIEDKDFYEHPGFSLRGIMRAFLTNIQEDEIAQGGSTISQQLMKNTLLNHNKTFFRKYQEIVLALELERRFSKQDILEMYLNTVYFGEGAFGIENASKAYFNKSAEDLTLAESALLAGILPAPSAYSPLSGSEESAFERQKLVLSQMRQQGYITEEEEQQALAEEITFTPQTDGLNTVAPHFALMVKDQLIDKYGEQRLASSGFTVKTTLDLEFQEFAEQTVKNQVTRLQNNKVTNGAALAVDPRTGEILVLVGSWDWDDENNGKINMVLRPRQPGSSIKPIVYAKAFEDRLLTPGSIIDDKEISFPGGYKPKNYDGKFRGNVTVRRALATSLNIPAVLTMEKVGVVDFISFAERMGVDSLDQPSRYGLSLALGAAEIPLIQMVEAFSTFANKGVKLDPIAILEVKDKQGKVIFVNKSTAKNALDNDVAFLISSILSDNSARTEVFGNSLTLSRTAAVKTGTTEDYRDSLTVGYTPRIVVGVWVGNNDNTPMDGIAGSSGAAPIWRSIMENILAGTSFETFTRTPGIRQVNICKENGGRITDTATSSAYLEFFLRGTEPKQDCGLTVAPTPSTQPTESPKPTDQPQATNTPEPSPTEQPQATSTPEPTDNLLPTILP